MVVNDVLSEAEYADIIVTLLQPPYSVASITKLVIISFCVKNENNHAKYANRKKDFVDIFISNVSIKLSTHRKEINQIIKVIDMLNKTSKVCIDGDNIALIHDFTFLTENSFLKFCKAKSPNPIAEVSKLSPKALIEEVVRYV